MDDWFWDEDDGMNGGVSGDDERISLWVSGSNFLFSLRGGGRGNSKWGIPDFSLCDLVIFEMKENEKKHWLGIINILLETEKSLVTYELKTKLQEFLQKKVDMVSFEKH